MQCPSTIKRKSFCDLLASLSLFSKYFHISICELNFNRLKIVFLFQAMHVDPFEFEWLEPPDLTALVFAAEELTLLGALDDQQNLTPLGHLISSLLIDPGIARMIYSACSKGLGK